MDTNPVFVMDAILRGQELAAGWLSGLAKLLNWFVVSNRLLGRLSKWEEHIGTNSLLNIS